MKSRRRYGAFYRRKGQLTIRPSERKGIRSSTASSETLPGENPPRGAPVRHTGRGRKDPSGLSKIAQGATPHFLIFNRPLLLRASFLDVLLSVYPRENALLRAIDIYTTLEPIIRNHLIIESSV